LIDGVLKGAGRQPHRLPALEGERIDMPNSGLNRRDFLRTTALTGGGAVMAEMHGMSGVFAAEPPTPAPAPASTAAPDRLPVTLQINGRTHQLDVDPRTTLLDTLRDHIGLTGTKKGCDMGACGACTVHADGRRILSCLTLAAAAQGRSITTIEGLAQGDRLHPVQAAFLEHDGFQCGYCTPGQIMSAAALIEEGRATSDANIREFMSGNLCRCGAYPNIVAAIRNAAGTGRA
jgi:xanthine dehydrogenase YagT iron-sulfur-binding subunit